MSTQFASSVGEAQGASRMIFRRRRLACAIIGASALLLLAAWNWGWLTAVPKACARSALAGRDSESALEWLIWADRLGGADPEIEFLRARAYRKQGRLDLVRLQIERAWSLGFPVKRLQREQILAQAQAGQLRQAEPMLRRLLTDQQDDGPEICEAFVNGYLLNSRFADALQLLRAWSADFPDDPLPHLVRGRIHIQLSQSTLAEEAFRRVVELDPQNSEAAYELAEVLLIQKRPQAALRWFEQAAAAADLRTRARIRQAHCLRNLGHSEPARRILREVILSDDSPPAALLELGKVFLDAQCLPEAVDTLRRAYEAEPENVEVRYTLAMALRRSGDLEEARDHAEWFQTAQAELTRAYDLAEKVTRTPDDLDLRFEIGKIHLAYGNRADGVKWLHGVLNLEPDHAATHALLAEYYRGRAHRDPEFARLAERHRAAANRGDVSAAELGSR